VLFFSAPTGGGLGYCASLFHFHTLFFVIKVTAAISIGWVIMREGMRGTHMRGRYEGKV
jgi:hypothetical protein